MWGEPGCENITGELIWSGVTTPCNEVSVTSQCFPPGTYCRSLQALRNRLWWETFINVAYTAGKLLAGNPGRRPLNDREP